MARLKRNRINNNVANYQSNFYWNVNRDIKKRRTDTSRKCDIGWRRGNSTKCFKILKKTGGGDRKKRLKPASPRDEYIIEITDEECEFKFIKIFNDCCVDEKGKKKNNEEVPDPSKCAGKQMCKVTTKCKIIRDTSNIAINNALTRVRRRHNKKCFDCTRKVECKVLKVLPKFYPPMVGPPLTEICAPKLNSIPDITICSPPFSVVPDLLCNFRPPFLKTPDVKDFCPPFKTVVSMNDVPEIPDKT